MYGIHFDHFSVVYALRTWKKVKEDVDEILVSPGDLVSVVLIVRDHLFGPSARPHARQVHEHHAGVHS